MDELDDHLVSGTFSSVEQMNNYWKEKVEQIFDLRDFGQRLRDLLQQMNCPWDV
jgi:hypothetical protein